MRPAPDPHTAALDRAAVRAEMDQARADFRRLVSDAAPADLRRASDGTRWTNQQLLFHMLLGYLITRALLILTRIFGLLPDTASRVLARLLDSAQRPFHLINYLGSRVGARLIPPRRMPAVLDHVIAALQRHLERETESALRRGMHYPATWDPFFASYMTLATSTATPPGISASTSGSSPSPAHPQPAPPGPRQQPRKAARAIPWLSVRRRGTWRCWRARLAGTSRRRPSRCPLRRARCWPAWARAWRGSGGC